MPTPAWRASLRPASFRGARFHVEAVARNSGRRTVLHEFPKKDTPYAEDMGRRARRFAVSGYIVDEDYIPLRDALIAACELEGAGLLVHPTMGEFMVQCEAYNSAETRMRGGFVEVDMSFVEAGSEPNFAPGVDTAAGVAKAAVRVGAAAVAQIDAVLALLISNGDAAA